MQYCVKSRSAASQHFPADQQSLGSKMGPTTWDSVGIGPIIGLQVERKPPSQALNSKPRSVLVLNDTVRARLSSLSHTLFRTSSF